MADHKIQVPRLPDRDIFRFFRNASEIIGTQKFTLHIFGASRVSEFDRAQEEEIKSSPLVKSDLYSIVRGATASKPLSVNLLRSDSNYGLDTLQLVSTDNPNVPALSDAALTTLNELIKKIFLPSSDPISALVGSPKAFEKLIESHQTMMGSLQSTATAVTEQIVEARLRLEEEYAERNSRLESEFQQRQTLADTTMEEIRQAAIRREQELQAREKIIDDRNNTHARRDLHKTLKARIADRAKKFEITPETKRVRLPIHIGVVAASILVAAAIYFYSIDLTPALASGSTSAIVYLAIKPAFLSVALLGLITWYIRWMNRWFERHADAEINLKQFELDIDRASWVVETALEWKEVQEKPMPDQLLENISRNLFVKGDKDEGADLHPADYLASALMGKASAVRLRTPIGEIDFDNKLLKQAGKSM